MQSIKPAQLSFDYILTRIFIYGIIWGLMEVYLSPVIKSYVRELYGIIMPFIISILIIFAYNFLPKTGVIASMAVIAALFEFFLAGMIFHGAFLAILLEGLIAELVILFFGLNLLSMVSTGILLQIYSMFHPLFTRGIFCQSTHFVFFKRWFTEHFMYLNEQWLIFILVSFHILFGILAGLIAFILIRKYNQNYYNKGIFY